MKNILPVFILIAGCAAPAANLIWVKPGADETLFAAEKAVCAERAGSDQKVFENCMTQNGWQLRDKRRAPAQAPSEELLKVFDELSREKDRRCAAPEYAAFFAKTACDPQSVTAVQAADKAMITPAEKEALIQLRVEMRKSQDKAAAAYKDYGGNRGAQSAQIMETWYLFNERNVDDLMSGRQNWGAYNRARRSLYLDLLEELKKVNS